ncbi:hypothetical protein WAI453_000662 [Rhynchosporium graminicola]
MAFYNRLSGPNAITVISMQELQSLDCGLNGKGVDFAGLVGDYEGGGIGAGCGGREGWNDVSTYGRVGWNEKVTDIWSTEEVQWRCDYIRGFLKGMWASSGRKGVEVVVVTHGSFWGSWVTMVRVMFPDVQLLSCVFDQGGGFREIGEEELRQLRDLAGKCSKT